ncbi:MAG: virulence RhuM family protein [Bacteroidales bacterium]|nr:virulence RhuM family protein [Bacteroidales bacterium]
MEQNKDIRQNGEIILYQPDNSIQLEVRMEEETVWLTQAQMALLFGCSQDNVGLHLKNLYAEGEIEQDATTEEISVVRFEGNRRVTRRIMHYNLDAILSVGYRVSSKNATKFRQWANAVLKEYLLRGYAVNQRIERLEQRVSKTEEQIGLFVCTSLPPVEGIFYDGQIFDAYAFASDLIRSARKRVILIDNYIDESVLMMLAKREEGVTADIVTRRVTEALTLDLERHNRQYSPVDVRECDRYHDRFLIIDDTVYHLGASLKDLGKKLFAFSRMEVRVGKITEGVFTE